jgi:nucleoside-diphosphate-sugar epimerase
MTSAMLPDDRPVVVTGASGFLGRSLLRALTREGLAVTAVSRQQHADHGAVRWIQGDLRDQASVARWLPLHAIVFHLGASLSGSASDIHESIVTGTAHLLATARGRQARVVHVSSLAVLDPVVTHGTGIVDERAAVDPKPEQRGAYSRAKILAEQLVRDATSEGADHVVVRPAQLVGESLAAVPPSVGVPRFGRMLLLADPKWGIPIVHVDDATDGLVLMAEAPAGTVVHLVDERYVPRGELLATLRMAKIPGADVPTLRIHHLSALCQRLPGGLARRLLALDTRAHFSAGLARAKGWQTSALGSWLSTGADPQPSISGESP